MSTVPILRWTMHIRKRGMEVCSVDSVRVNLLLFPSLPSSFPRVDALGNTCQASDGASAFPAAPGILLLFEAFDASGD
jgi:hypothetical protein